MADPGSADAAEAALDELYAVDPADFVETRKRLAADLKATGDKEAVKAVQAARRPTTAAWALNQLTRAAPDVLDAYFERSNGLRAVLAGTAPGGRGSMRDATREQRQALADAADAAVAALGVRATEAFRTQIVSTLQAAGADEAVGSRLRQGRLVKEVTTSTGFPDVPTLTLVPDLTPPPAAARPKPPKRKQAPPERPAPDRAAARKAERDEQRRQERERAALEQAQRRVEEAEAAAARAQEIATAAEAAAVDARAIVVRLQDELEQARRDARATDDTAATARREATRLARAATRLRSRE